MIGWVDASSGASGDMLLGALVGAGVPVEVLQEAVDRVSPEPVRLRVEQVDRAGITATRVHVETTDTGTTRTWRDIRAMLDPALDQGAVRTFTRLAEAEAAVHDSAPEDVHFHEVGALDAIADIVGVCAGLAHLGLDRLVVSTIALGGGRVRAAHGSLPVPAPAVANLLLGVPTAGGPVEQELCTPTGAALLTAHATGFGAQPEMVTAVIGIGAGGRDPEGHPNVLRLFLGEGVSTRSRSSAHSTNEAVIFETNVDDLDPRLWPDVIAALLRAGAADAWLTPILMKKGRPAHTLHVLVAADRAVAVRDEIFRQTSTIGLRETTVAKHALDRRFEEVVVDGRTVAVKVAGLEGRVLTAQPEYADVVAAAAALDRPVKDVLAEASAAARKKLC